jgi:heme/copper-type cytochrome/quinol oxidase subunit 1
MTIIDTHVGATTHAQGAGSAFVVSVGQWITSSDHKKIGRLFIGTSLLSALLVAVLGLIFGLERMSPAHMQIFDGDATLQLFSLYQFALVFGVLAPLFVGIAIAVVPTQIGARAVAFPRVAQFGFWAWLFGALMVDISIIGNGGPGGGATDLVDLYLLGVALAAVGLLAASLSVATSVLTARAPGMTLDRVPAFSWSALVGSIATLLSLPVMIGTIIYVYVDHTHAQLIFGGNKGINSFLGWSLSQPMTFVFVIMALGVLAEVAPVTARTEQPLRPIVLAGLGIISTAVLGAVTQSSQILDWAGTNSDKVQNVLLHSLFNGLPLLGMLIVVLLSLLCLKVGTPRVTASFALSLLGVLMIIVGVLGNGLYTLKPASLDGTVFSEGVVLYLVYGGLLSALGALSHWAPQLWGRAIDNTKLLGLALIGLLGTILASFPLYIAGFADQPANAVMGFDYDGPIALWNVLSGLGHALIALTVLGFIALLIDAVRNGEAVSQEATA